MPHLTYDGDSFYLRCTYAEREIAKNAGFFWHKERKLWFTKTLQRAVKLRIFADAKAETVLASKLLTKTVWDKPIHQTPQLLMPHQHQAVRFALERNRCYLGLDPGLGKTAVAATVAATLDQPVTYVCPPFLLPNVLSEFRRWAPGFKKLNLVRDSLLSSGNFSFSAPSGSILVVDEAHRFKNDESKRTKALFGAKNLTGLIHKFQRVIFMSGTPMPNRPIELFPVLSTAAPETIDFMPKFDYGRRYCAGHMKEGGFGWDFSGASNVPELAKKVIHPTGPFMLRLKKDLLDLPPKLEEAFVVSDTMPAELKKIDHRITETNADIEELIKHRLATQNTGDDVDHVAVYRRLLGVEKVKPTVQFIKEILEDNPEENILLFAYHREVIRSLAEKLNDYRPLVVTGETPPDARQSFVDRYQRDKTYRLFIGNYQAAGIGFTLTKATRVIFCEFDWVPGVNDQASDRAHRIGQTKTVLVQYIVFANSLDEAVIRTLLRKRQSVKHI